MAECLFDLILVQTLVKEETKNIKSVILFGFLSDNLSHLVSQ